MTIDRDTRENFAFVLDAETLKKLTEFLEKHFSNLSYAVDCADGLTRTYSLDELLQYQNPIGKHIEDLKITNSHNDASQVRIRLSKAGDLSIALWGDLEVVTHTNEFLNDWKSSLRPWYWTFVRTLKLSTLLGLIVPAAIIGVVLAIAINSLTEYNAVANFVDFQGVEFWIPYIVLLSILGGVFGQFYDKMFPVSEFAIGQGAKRYRRRESFRITVLGGLVVSILGTVIYSVLY